jgi:hypothetical protein
MAVGVKTGASVLKAVGVKNGVYRPLKMKVYCGGRVVQTILIPDPRERFAKAWNAFEKTG